MIDSVRQTVLSILNKNNYGYVSPSDFNLFAKQAQLEIFEGYFNELNKAINAENARMSGTDYANMTKGSMRISMSSPCLSLWTLNLATASSRRA